jgi:hypothetical protein
MSRVVVRCSLNKYRTPLLSYDRSGIYVRCKDCMTVDGEGDIKRGTYHLIAWSEVLALMFKSAFDFVTWVENANNRSNTSGIDQSNEGSDNAGHCCGGGDPGGRLPEPEFQVQGTEAENASDGASNK